MKVHIMNEVSNDTKDYTEIIVVKNCESVSHTVYNKFNGKVIGMLFPICTSISGSLTSQT